MTRDEQIHSIIQETALAVSNATKSEVSGLIGQFKKDVQTITEHLAEQDKKLAEFQPMLDAFKETEKYKMVYTSTGIKIVKTAGYITAIIAAMYLLRQLFGDITKIIK